MKKRYYVLGGVVVAVGLVVAFWNWDWFIPLAERQASAAIGRKVTIGHLHVHLARQPLVAADNIRIDNPDGFPADPPFASADRLQVQLDIPAYLHDRSIVIPSIEIDRPAVEAQAKADGSNNYTFQFASGSSSSGATSPPPKIGALRITDGTAHVVMPKVKSDFNLAIATRDEAGKDPQLVVDAKGAYSGQPVIGRFIGGALLSLRDKESPYPIDLQLANGPTKVTLQGTVQDPVAFAGANLKLHFSGPDLALLYPLTGVPIPQTPSYDLTGNLDYADKRIKFQNFSGRLGSSDLEGEIDVEPGQEREQVFANIASKKIDLTDLGGFIGSTPGRAATPNQTPQQKAQLARAEASDRLIPNTPINLPKLRAADIELKYRGAHIIGRSIPLDDVRVDLAIKDGNIDLHPISFGVGGGQIVGNIKLNGEKDSVRAHADVDLQRVDLARLMASLHSFQGNGKIGGKIVFDSTGNSLGTMLGNGNGEAKVFMSGGGNLSALLVDLSGLQFGSALLSALGVPDKTQVQCFIGDMGLQRGILSTRTLLLDTNEANVNGTGTINLRDETLDYRLRTESKHFSIGSLNAPILIDGKLKSPSIRPDAAELGARAGAAVGLGVVLTPLAALLPTIQLGLGEDNYCSPLLRTAEKPPTTANSATPRRATR